MNKTWHQIWAQKTEAFNPFLNLIFKPKHYLKFSIKIKQVGVLNVDGYYDGLLGLFDKGVEEGFINPSINPSSRTIVVSASTASELLNLLEVSTVSIAKRGLANAIILHMLPFNAKMLNMFFSKFKPQV